MRLKPLIFFALSITIVLLVSSLEDSSIRLYKGKNIFEPNWENGHYVRSIVALNPMIEVVSYNKDNETIGYVNIFDGIGEDFIMRKGISYEIIVSEDMSFVLPK